MPTESFLPNEKQSGTVPIKALGLTIKDTPLEAILGEFAEELDRVGIRRVKPVFYLSTEWGVPFGTVAIAIPFYLARLELTKLHAERVGHIEGSDRADILRYLRHEMGHVVNYAYQLYDDPEWQEQFGSIEQAYEEEYRPEPFSRRHVRHLPGWYAQKHPDEDWAETFAVWMSPSVKWREEYRDWPIARAKLEYCDRVMTRLSTDEPRVTAADLDEDVGELGHSLDEFYGEVAVDESEFPHGLSGALRSIFEDVGRPEDGSNEARLPAGPLIRSLEQELMATVYRWTGHFPERTRVLLRNLATRAEALEQVYNQQHEQQVIVGLTTLVTALAMNHVHRGSYVP